jgi:hypothetical protein
MTTDKAAYWVMVAEQWVGAVSDGDKERELYWGHKLDKLVDSETGVTPAERIRRALGLI